MVVLVEMHREQVQVVQQEQQVHLEHLEAVVQEVQVETTMVIILV